MTVRYTKTLTRPSQSVNFFTPDNSEDRKIARALLEKELKEEGRLISSVVVMSADQLVSTRTWIFNSREAYDEYIGRVAETIPTEARDSYNDANGITLTETVEDLEDTPPE